MSLYRAWNTNQPCVRCWLRVLHLGRIFVETRLQTDERMARDYVKLYHQIIQSKSASMTVEEGALNWIEVESPTPSTT